MRVVVLISGSKTVHITLCVGMAKALRQVYPRIGATLMVSNASLIAAPQSVALSRRLERVGFIANLSAAKGLDDVLELAEACAAKRLAIEIVVAGPFEDSADAPLYTARFQQAKNVRYVGPVYGTEKDKFFANIDAFVFPTRYKHEAEPLVLLEAMSRGRPCIAYGRGCIPCMLSEGAGRVVEVGTAFTPVALECLIEWLENDAAYQEAAHAASARFQELRSESVSAMENLMDAMAESSSADTASGR